MKKLVATVHSQWCKPKAFPSESGQGILQCCRSGSWIWCHLTPGCGIQIRDGTKSRSRFRNPGLTSQILFLRTWYQFFGLKISADSDPGSCQAWIRDPGWEKSDPQHSFFVTLFAFLKLLLHFFNLISLLMVPEIKKL
jgi:hypothetical protein